MCTKGHRTIMLGDVRNEPRTYLTDSIVTLRTGLLTARWTTATLWTHHLAIGGNLTYEELCRSLDGHRELDDTEHDLLAVALNEHLTDIGVSTRVRWSEDLDRARHHPVGTSRPTVLRSGPLRRGLG